MTKQKVPKNKTVKTRSISPKDYTDSKRTDEYAVPRTSYAGLYNAEFRASLANGSDGDHPYAAQFRTSNWLE